MTPTSREALRRAAEKATPGPWRQSTYDGHDGPRDCDEFMVQALIEDYWDCLATTTCWHTDKIKREQQESNSEFIALCDPQTILGLLDEVERLERERDGERIEREKCSELLSIKDHAMGVLFNRLHAAGADYSDLIS